MPTYIIECDDPEEIILGMRCVRAMIALEERDGSTGMMLSFDNGSLFYVKKTKTGYSVRAAGKT